MSTHSIITYGFGIYGSVNRIATYGFYPGDTTIIVIPLFDKEFILQITTHMNVELKK